MTALVLRQCELVYLKQWIWLSAALLEELIDSSNVKSAIYIELSNIEDLIWIRWHIMNIQLADTSLVASSYAELDSFLPSWLI